MKLQHYYKTNPMRTLLFAASAVSASFLAVALVAQFGFNLPPCELCIAQRVPYAIIAMLALVAGMKVPSKKKLSALLLACILLFVLDGGIAAYHSGVEMGIVKGPSGCTNSDKPGQTLEEMRAAIMNAQLVPCDQPMAYFLGLSMASWNMIAALLSAIGFFVLRMRVLKRSGGLS